jgi:hypothetical protein
MIRRPSMKEMIVAFESSKIGQLVSLLWGLLTSLISVIKPKSTPIVKEYM